MTQGERVPVARGRGAASRGSHVYDELLSRIRAGELGPGTRLREDEIGTLLGVSRTPVREALARLQARGLVEAIPGGLAIVELTRPRILELYAMRGMLEGAAARFAADNASTSDLAALKHLEVVFSGARGNADEFARLNLLFHEAIYEAAHNRYLMRMLADLNDSLTLLPDTTFSVAGRIEAAVAEHRDILTAIENRDPGKAENAARMHIQNAMDARLSLLFAASP